MSINFIELVERSKGRYWEERICAQIQYARRLSRVNNGIYGELIDSAEKFVVERFDEDGAITRSSAHEAEEMLKSISHDAKKYRIICAAHAHIDMNWMWRWDETVAITLDTFNTMLTLMDEYKDFKFSQSQASVYKIVEDYDPKMLEKIKARVKEGRWEITASSWVEADKNLPNGESLARHILYTKKYLSRLFEIEPKSLNVDFEPDTFGHNLNVPEILSKGGVEFYYHCRGYEGHNIYRWKAPSGSSIIVYREPLWYNANIESEMALYVPEFCSKHGLDTMLKVYGVGDHGGGPTRRDIEKLLDMSTWPVFPEIRFGSFKEYFSILERSALNIPEVEGELNFVFDGCYTTQSRIKEGNRASEALLNEAETFCSLSSIAQGSKYPSDDFCNAWENVLFNQFHDIIPGSGTVDTREYAMGLYQKTWATANNHRSIALRSISMEIDTKGLVPEGRDLKETISEGAGVGFGIEGLKVSQTSREGGRQRIFHFFNPSLHAREGLAEVIVWDWHVDHNGELEFVDEKGVKVKFQVVDSGFNHYWSHTYVRVLVNVKIPALGYVTYLMKEVELQERNLKLPGDPRVQKVDDLVLENNLIKVSFDPINASIISLVDKETGEEMSDPKRPMGIFRAIEEDNHDGMSAWIVGRYMSVTDIHKNVKINKKKFIKGLLKNSIDYEIEYGKSKLNVAIWLEEGSPFINYDVNCDWREFGVKYKKVPQLSFFVPVNYRCTAYRYDVPFGSIEREGMGIDVPANSWVLGKREETGRKAAMLITRSKYGFRSDDDSMSITLLRSAYDPDPYPEIGIHTIKFALGVVDNSSTNKDLINLSYDYNHSINVISGSLHKGKAPLSREFISIEKGSVIASAVKMPEEDTKDRLIVRVYETDGNKATATLKVFKEPRNAYYVDINEQVVKPLDLKISIQGDKVCFDIMPYSLANIVLEF
jgi:alpha-mannosidase